MANTTAYSKLESDSRFGSKNDVAELKQEIIAIGSGVGGKSYYTHAEALAVDPLPSDGTIYTLGLKLENGSDNPDAGVYAYDSTTVDGYRFVNELTVYKEMAVPGNNKLNPAYIQQDKAIASNGNVANLAGAISYVMLPLQPSTTYTLSGFLNSANKYMAMKNSSGATVGSVILLNPGTPKTFTTPNAETFLNIYGKLVAEGNNWDDTLMLNEGATALPYEPYTEQIEKINEKEIIAKRLSDGNSVPMAVNAQNAVNKEYFDLYALRTVDLSVTQSSNLAKSEFIVNGQYINNAGGISSGTGWAMIGIPIDSYATGQKITYGRFTINTGGYSAFYNGSTLVEFIGSGTSRTVTKPATATHLFIDIKRPADDGSNYAELTVNLGDVLLPYENPNGKITSIKGYEVEGSGGGGEVYDQSLNTTDEVEFASVSASEINASVLVLNLPTSSSGLPSGRAWIDTANGNVIKVVS